MIPSDLEYILSRNDMSYFHGKSILITGASGLVGLYVISLLQHVRKYGIISQLHLVTKRGFPANVNIQGTQIWQGDLTDHAFLKSLPSCNCVIHAAGYGQPIKFLSDPIKTISLNTTTTCSLFDKLLSEGRFLYISSSEIYEGSLRLPYQESDIGRTTPSHARSCYIEGKRCGETICNYYCQQGVYAKIARLSLAYGPGTRKDDDRAINSFIRQGLLGQIELKDNGAAMRTYCYIADAIDVLMSILTRGKETVYNVGGESRITILQLAQLIGSIMNVPVVFPDSSTSMKEAPRDVMLDLTRIGTEFKKRYFISIEEGVSRTIAWQKQAFMNNL